MQNNKVKKLAYCAMCLALAVVTNAITIFSLPNGGSITPCSMLFASLPGFFFGPAYGIVSGVAFGVLNFILKPYFYTPLQFICDYILAFGALGLSGLFAEKKNGLYIGYIVGCLGRFFFSFLSGVLFFAEYAPEGMSPAVYSAGYNISYIGIEMVLTLIILAVPAVRSALQMVKNNAKA